MTHCTQTVGTVISMLKYSCKWYLCPTLHLCAGDLQTLLTHRLKINSSHKVGPSRPSLNSVPRLSLWFPILNVTHGYSCLISNCDACEVSVTQMTCGCLKKDCDMSPFCCSVFWYIFISNSKKSTNLLLLCEVPAWKATSWDLIFENLNASTRL